MTFLPAELIKKKRNKQPLNADELEFFILSYVKNEIPDYQMSALLMTIFLNGMNREEVALLTRIMKNSGFSFDFSYLNAARVDKHSTGGVGDKTSLILGPIVACAGIYVPMIAGRGLGHTGGTLDKLESIPGFKINLTSKEFQKNIEHYHFSLMGQTENICPADRKMYALRDVTATIESLPLICASIMSKKLSEGLTGLVLDIKYGSGAFMKSLADAEALAQLLKSTGEDNGLKVTALLTSMEQPLGRFIGNSLEVKECVDILEGKSLVQGGINYYQDTIDLSLHLAGHMIYLGGKAPTPEAGFAQAQEILNSGKALNAFLKLCDYQGPSDPYKLPIAKNIHPVLSPQSGIVQSIDTEKIGLVGVAMGAGRKKTTDKIDYAVGLEMNCRIGMKVQKGKPLLFIHHNGNADMASHENDLLAALKIADKPVTVQPLIKKVIQ